VPVLAVRGNTDRARVVHLIECHSNISCPHLKAVTINNIRFVGLSGTIPLPFGSRICMNESRVLNNLTPLLQRDTVLIAHPPPRGTLDQVFGKFHAGCRSLRRIVTRYQPRLLVCGHIHEKRGTAFIGKTLVVNCSMGRTGGGALIEVDGNQSPKTEML
jgi:Icc-related predicted phosphoesterase